MNTSPRAANGTRRSMRQRELLAQEPVQVGKASGKASRSHKNRSAAVQY